MITELKACPKCSSSNMKKVVWKQQGYAPSGDMRKTIDKFGIGCLIEWVCQSCGFKHTEN